MLIASPAEGYKPPPPRRLYTTFDDDIGVESMVYTFNMINSRSTLTVVVVPVRVLSIGQIDLF